MGHDKGAAPCTAKRSDWCDGALVCNFCLERSRWCDTCNVIVCVECQDIARDIDEYHFICQLNVCTTCLPAIARAVEQVVRLDPSLPPDCARIVASFLGGSREVWEAALETSFLGDLAARQRRRALTLLLRGPLVAWVACKRRRHLQQRVAEAELVGHASRQPVDEQG